MSKLSISRLLENQRQIPIQTQASMKDLELFFQGQEISICKISDFMILQRTKQFGNHVHIVIMCFCTPTMELVTMLNKLNTLE